MEDNAGVWSYPVTDGLYSVRSMVDHSLNLAEDTQYTPMGVAQTPLTTTPFHFTGEMLDENGWQYHRARYYAPDLGRVPIT